MNECGVGCGLANAPVSHIPYTDDLALLVPSVSAMNDPLSLWKIFLRIILLFSAIQNHSGCIFLREVSSVYLGVAKLLSLILSVSLGITVSCHFHDDQDIYLQGTERILLPQYENLNFVMVMLNHPNPSVLLLLMVLHVTLVTLKRWTFQRLPVNYIHIYSCYWGLHHTALPCLCFGSFAVESVNKMMMMMMKKAQFSFMKRVEGSTSFLIIMCNGCSVILCISYYNTVSIEALVLQGCRCLCRCVIVNLICTKGFYLLHFLIDSVVLGI